MMPLDLSFLVQVCVVGMAVAAFLMVSRMRFASLMTLYALQALLLSLAVASFAALHADTAAYVVAALILALKGLFIPRWFTRTIRAHGASERLAAFVRPTTLSFAAFLLICFAGAIVRSLAVPGVSYLILASSIALLFMGFLMLVSRKDMIGLGVGFLVVENGVFTLGFALTGGMPLLVELGILFDLSVLFVLILALARRAQHEHASLATDYLHELIG
jgi:hydrogenase-4 component E